MKRLECKLDNGEYAACESPLQVSNLADGAHTLSVRAVDVADNVDATPATHTWTVDTVAPDTGILTGPSGPTASKSAAFTYQGDALGGTAIAGYECRIDDGAWGACVDYTGLAEGEHRFEARAIDAAGNTDGSPATRTWTVDTIAPDTAIESGPDALTNTPSASFTYSGGDRYECKLDDGAWGDCRAYQGLADGEHRFQVRAIDAAGNTDDSPATRTWTVDTIAPDTTIGSGPAALTNSRSASFTYSGGDRVECGSTAASWAACRDTYTDLADREHLLEARASTRPATPISHRRRTRGLSTRSRRRRGSSPGPPRSPATALPRSRTRTAPATSAGSTTPPGRVRRLHRPRGRRDRFRVRAIDAAGNVDDSPAVHTWTIDLTAPTTTIADKPRAREWETDRALPLDRGRHGRLHRRRLRMPARRRCVRDARPRASGPDLVEGDHTFEARAADAAGNVEDPAVSYTWRVRLLNPVDDEATTRENTPVTIDVGANDVRPGTATLAADAASAKGGTSRPMASA